MHGEGYARGALEEPAICFLFGRRLHAGCCQWQGSCYGTCDKAHNGMVFDRCLLRWVVTHFGQAPAGWLLNCIALCLPRHITMCNSAERRGDSFITSNGVVWIDKFIFINLFRTHAA